MEFICLWVACYQQTASCLIGCCERGWTQWDAVKSHIIVGLLVRWQLVLSLCRRAGHGCRDNRTRVKTRTRTRTCRLQRNCNCTVRMVKHYTTGWASVSVFMAQPLACSSLWHIWNQADPKVKPAMTPPATTTMCTMATIWISKLLLY